MTLLSQCLPAFSRLEDLVEHFVSFIFSFQVLTLFCTLLEGTIVATWLDPLNYSWLYR